MRASVGMVLKAEGRSDLIAIVLRAGTDTDALVVQEELKDPMVQERSEATPSTTRVKRRAELLLTDSISCTARPVARRETFGESIETSASFSSAGEMPDGAP